MDRNGKVCTVCRSCHGGYGVITHIESGRVVKVEAAVFEKFKY